MAGRIHARIDPDLKTNVSAILKGLGLNESDAIRLFYQQIKLNRGIPFAIKIPNEETLETFRKTDEGVDLSRHKNVADIFKDI